MKPYSPFSFFDEIYCISMPTRSEKRERAMRQFEQIGILDRVVFFDAIIQEPHWIGCRESHRACIRKAKSNGAENVFIFEEDVFFLHRDISALDSALNSLSKFSWEVFTLGQSVHKVKDHLSENLCLVKSNLTHAHALHKRCWDEVLNYPDTTECIDVDSSLRSGQPRTGHNKVYNLSNIDSYMSRRFEKFMIKPIMAVQPDKASPMIKKYYSNIL
jgi:GR25 family glycosyltransferase involved in LPS biosynthesis